MRMYIGLAGPLLLYIYLPIVLLVLAILIVKIKSWKTCTWAIPLYLLLAYAIPLGDVTWHSWNMNKACKNAGLHVYRTVVVDGFIPEQSVSEGVLEKYPYQFIETRPRKNKNDTVFRLERVNEQIIKIDGAQPLAEWEYIRAHFDHPDKSLGVTVDREVIRNRRTGEVIAEDFSFKVWRGWIDAKIASVIDNVAGVCYVRPGMYEKFPEILIPSGERK